MWDGTPKSLQKNKARLEEYNAALVDNLRVSQSGEKFWEAMKPKLGKKITKRGSKQRTVIDFVKRC